MTHRRKWIDPQDFRDLRKCSGLTRKQAGEVLNVTPRTIQNWETGGARIPWMAFRLLRITQGYALPCDAWEGWTVAGAVLYAPNGKGFAAPQLEYLEQTFAMARLWREEYSAAGRARKAAQAAKVVPFPIVAPELQKPATEPLRQKGGTR